MQRRLLRLPQTDAQLEELSDSWTLLILMPVFLKKIYRKKTTTDVCWAWVMLTRFLDWPLTMFCILCLNVDYSLLQSCWLRTVFFFEVVCMLALMERQKEILCKGILTVRLGICYTKVGYFDECKNRSANTCLNVKITWGKWLYSRTVSDKRSSTLESTNKLRLAFESFIMVFISKQNSKLRYDCYFVIAKLTTLQHKLWLSITASKCFAFMHKNRTWQNVIKEK